MAQILLWLLGWMLAQAGDGRGEDLGICRYNAVLFAAYDYDTLRDLKSPKRDVELIAALLERVYGFETPRIVENPTRAEILNTLLALRDLEECDALIIYYAGHGLKDEASENGFWLPVDADSKRQDKWVGNADVLGHIRALKAKHVLLVSDSCFSGSFFDVRGGKPAQGPEVPFQKLTKHQSRWVMTSGANETVLDGLPGGKSGMSVFSRFFFLALENADQRYVVPQRLFPTIEEGVTLNARQVPQQGPLNDVGHQLGRLVPRSFRPGRHQIGTRRIAGGRGATRDGSSGNGTHHTAANGRAPVDRRRYRRGGSSSGQHRRDDANAWRQPEFGHIGFGFQRTAQPCQPRN